MKLFVTMKTVCCLFALGLSVRPLAAAPLTESIFTEIFHEVNTLTPAGNIAPAKVNDLLKSHERVRTGAHSRAELTAADHTITRVGANTVFSFADSGRTLQLEKGSLLFHSPKGNGGGTIKCGSAAAAVLGTTLIVAATDDGGFKVIFLEGSGEVTLPGGKKFRLRAGQMIFIAPGGDTASRVLGINLEKLVNGSRLLDGFSSRLPSLPRIVGEIKKQNHALAAGSLVDTGASAEKPATVGGSFFPGTGWYPAAVHPPISPAQFTAIVNVAQIPNPADPAVQPVGTGRNGPGGASLTAVGFAH